jgi:hypothetical protein
VNLPSLLSFDESKVTVTCCEAVGNAGLVVIWAKLGTVMKIDNKSNILVPMALWFDG